MTTNVQTGIPTQKDMLVETFGRFGLLAQRVAQGSFSANLLGEENVHTTSIRCEKELLTRISAFSALARISRNRLLCELLQEAVDELESQMATENPEGFENYLLMYERLCELAMDARA